MSKQKKQFKIPAFCTLSICLNVAPYESTTLVTYNVKEITKGV